MRRSKSDYVIQTVSNALRLLEVFGDEEELGVTEISRRLALHKNNVFRLLATLEEKGYVEQSLGSERYRLGVRCLEVGQAYAHSRTLVRLARPAVEALSLATGETAHLGTLEAFQVVHLDGEQPPHLVVTPLRVGRRLDAHCTALGKMLLACRSPSAWESITERAAEGGALAAHTPATVQDRDKLFDHLQAVASQGFAIDLEECEQGLCCAAAPVFDASGHAVGALSVSAPLFRLGEEALRGETVPQVVGSAGDLSRKLGWAG